MLMRRLLVSACLAALVGAAAAQETLEIRIRPETIIDVLQADDEAPASTVTLTVPARLTRTGMERRHLVDGADSGQRGNVQPNLVKLI